MPPALAGQRVRVHTSQGTRLHVFTAAGERVAVHRLSEVKGATVLNPAHRLRAQRAPCTPVLLERRFRGRFPGQDDFLQRLYEAHPARPSDALRAVLSLAAIHSPDAMVSAFASVLLYHTFTPRFLAGLLTNVPPENGVPAPEAPYRSELPRAAVSRDLAAYQRAATGRWGTMTTEIERVRSQLTRLGLRTIAECFEAEAEVAAKGQCSFVAFLGRLVDLEAAAKTDHSIRARISRAHFPAFCNLESFDLGFQPSLNAAAVRELASLGFLHKAVNALWTGPPGVGKSHLAVAIDLKACQAHRSVLFVKAADLLDQLLAASVNRTLGQLLASLTHLDLLIIDEVGYLPLSRSRPACCSSW